MYCPNCGAECADTVKFCTKCGTPMQAQQPVEQPAYAQPVQQPTYAQQPQPTYAQPAQQPVYAQQPQMNVQQSDYAKSMNAQTQAPVQPTVAAAAPKKRQPKVFCVGAIAALIMIVLSIIYCQQPGMNKLEGQGLAFVALGLLTLSILLFVNSKITIAVGCFIGGAMSGFYYIPRFVDLAQKSKVVSSTIFSMDFGSYPAYIMFHLAPAIFSATLFLLGVFAIVGYDKKKLAGLFTIPAVASAVCGMAPIAVIAVRRFSVFKTMIAIGQNVLNNLFPRYIVLPALSSIFGMLVLISIASVIANPYASKNEDGYEHKHVKSQRFAIGGHIVFLLLFSGIYFFVWTIRATNATNGVMNKRDRSGIGQLLLRFIPFYSIAWYVNRGKRLALLGANKNVAVHSTAITVLGIFVPLAADIVLQAEINRVASAE